MKRIVGICTLALLGCATEAERPVKAIVGATLLNPNQPPVEYSVILVSGSTIVRAGTMADVPLPAGSEKIAAYGKFVVPSAAGAVEAGKPADLRLLGEDPRKNPNAAPERVLSAGEWTQ
jgi:hypothetical protein